MIGGRKWVWWALISGLILVFVGGALCWRAAGVRTRVVASVPPRPDLQGFTADFALRLDEAEHAARRLFGAAEGLGELARLYHANEFLPEAAACESALLQLDPANALWPYLRAHTLGGFGNLDDAIPLLRRTVKLAPDYFPAQVRLADALFKLNQTSEAASIYQKVLGGDAANGYAVVGLARYEMATGHAADARVRLQRIVTAEPSFAPAWLLLISADEQLGDQAAAETHRLQARATGRPREMPDPWVDALLDDCYDPYRLSVAASSADPANNQSRARQLLERAVSIAPQYDLAHRLLGNLLSDLGDLAAARTYLERATAINPKEPDNWSHLVRVLKASGDVAAAGRALSTGMAQCPDSPSLLVERGRRYAAAGDLARAAADFEQARRLRPEESNASVELAMLHFKMDRVEEGIAELRKALAVDPDHPIAVVILARYSIEKNDREMAAFWLNRVRRQTKIAPADVTAVEREFAARFGSAPGR